MVREKFEDYIIDNGFMFKGLEFQHPKYNYKIITFHDCYYLHNGSEWIEKISYTDLIPLYKILRNNKLNKILYK